MTLEILLSCMNQTDMSIIEKSKITGDVLIINQADHALTEERNKGNQHIRMITTTERGLSNSRNMAIQNAAGDICLLSDDDEVFTSDYENTILNAFQTLPQADVIAFHVSNKTTRLGPTIQQIGYFNTLKIASYQIAFRRKSVIKHQLLFDPLMGAGSGNGCGEENKFLIDCLKNGLKIYFYPAVIADLQPQSSTWFFGFNKDFFYQRGSATRYYLGSFFSILYGIYYLTMKYSLYRKDISFWSASAAFFHGYFKNNIACQKRLQIEHDSKLEKL